MSNAVLPTAMRRLARFCGDRRGVSAVEFALILPLLLVTYFGSIELSQALTAYRKTNHLAAVVGDLVAQSSGLTIAEMNNIFDAAAAVMTPFDPSRAKMVVGYVLIDDTGKQKVVWSAARNRSPYAVGAPPPVTLPASLATPNSTIVVTETEFKHETSFAQVLYDFFGSESVVLKATSYFRPRGSVPITYSS